MPNFHYDARDRAGTSVSGDIEAITLREAKQKVIAKNLVLLKIKEKSTFTLPSFENIFSNVSEEEMLVFNRQLQTSYGVGISIVHALNMISEQTENPKLKKIIASLVLDLTEGHSLHQAMAKYPKVFSPIYVNAIMAGESSGKMDQILGMLSQFAEQRMEHEAKIKSALFYPKIVGITILIVLMVVMTMVVPKLKIFYGRFGADLPPVTVWVMATSDFFVNYWYILAMLIGAGFYGFKTYVGTSKGLLQWHKFLLKTPVFGQIILQYDLLSFAMIMRLLVQSGIPIVESLPIVRNSLRNQVLKNEISKCQDYIVQGKGVAYGFNQSRVIPKMVANLLAVGEESGNIESILDKIASYYKLQVDYKLNNLSKAIEPIFLGIIFGIVLVLALAVFMPIWKMSSVVKMH